MKHTSKIEVEAKIIGLDELGDIVQAISTHLKIVERLLGELSQVDLKLETEIDYVDED